MSAVEVILHRVDGAKQFGKGWRAKCPACGGRDAKLSISEGEDGKVLLRCFGGCEALAVVQALGLTLGDLFPERVRSSPAAARAAAMEAQWAAALTVLVTEASITFFAAQRVARGEALAPVDADRLALSIGRISDARDVLARGLALRPAFKPRQVSP